MSNKKRVLFAYDGSESADAAIEDLKYAGLPAETEVLVVTVADVFLPPSDASKDAVPVSIPEPIAERVKKGWAKAAETVEKCRNLAEQAAKVIKINFPKWQVTAAAFADSPSWGIVKKAEEWKADLIVVGAHGFASTGRLVIGSLSQLVATQAGCSVRIVHSKPNDLKSAPRIVVGVDGSAYSHAALQEACSRNWKQGAAVHFVTVADPRMLTAVFSSDENAGDGIEPQKMIAAGSKILESKGCTATSFHKEGDPKKVLLEESERWGADCIFVGARGLSGIVHSLMGSVSSAIAARSHCTVEIVRKK